MAERFIIEQEFEMDGDILRDDEYILLKPTGERNVRRVEDVDAECEGGQNSVVDILANLTRRVHELEKENVKLRADLETWANDYEDFKQASIAPKLRQCNCPTACNSRGGCACGE